MPSTCFKKRLLKNKFCIMHESYVTFSLFLRTPPPHALSMRCSRLTAAHVSCHVPIPTFLFFFSSPLLFLPPAPSSLLSLTSKDRNRPVSSAVTPSAAALQDKDASNLQTLHTPETPPTPPPPLDSAPARSDFADMEGHTARFALLLWIATAASGECFLTFRCLFFAGCPAKTGFSELVYNI